MIADAVTGRVDSLSLADCYAYDPRPLKVGGYLRFKCPVHGGDRQKSLSVKEGTGRFTCHNCDAWGTVTEHRPVRTDGFSETPRVFHRKPAIVKAEPLEKKEYAVARAKMAATAYFGSPAQQYAQSRGVPDVIARAHGLGYWRGVWQGCDSEWLMFPMRCPITGLVIGVYGRNIHSNDGDVKSRLLGKRGCFGATKPGPMPEDVIACEGPFEAIACLLSPGLPPARAFFGCMKRPEWFDDCRRVVILGDDDEPNEKGRIPGKEAVDRLVDAINQRNQERKTGPRVLALPHGVLRERYGVKDLGDLLKQKIPIVLDLPPIVPLVPAVPDYLAFLQEEPAPVAAVPVPVVPDDPHDDRWLDVSDDADLRRAGAAIDALLPDAEDTAAEGDDPDIDLDGSPWPADLHAQVMEALTAARSGLLPIPTDDAPLFLRPGIRVPDPNRWLLLAADRVYHLRCRLQELGVDSHKEQASRIRAELLIMYGEVADLVLECRRRYEAGNLP